METLGRWDVWKDSNLFLEVVLYKNEPYKPHAESGEKEFPKRSEEVSEEKDWSRDQRRDPRLADFITYFITDFLSEHFTHKLTVGQ